MKLIETNQKTIVMKLSKILRTKTRCLEENEEKHGRKENPERKKKIKERPLRHL